MTIGDLKAQIMTHKLTSLYIFVGTEIAVRDIYIKQIAKTYDCQTKWLDEITDINDLRRNSPLQKSTLYIISEYSPLIKEPKYLEMLKDLGNNHMICLYTALDKRTKFYKDNQDRIVEFDTLPLAILRKYVQKEVQLSDKNADKLIELCENDYGRCLLEIDKIKRFDSEGVNSAFEHLLKAGVIYQPPKDAIFDFVDAVMSRDVNKTFRLMRESYDCGEATMVMIVNLYNNFKALLQVQSCKSRNIAESTGLTAWQINNAKKHVGKYRVGELVNALQLIRKAELGIKTGEQDEQFAVENLLVQVL